MTLVGQHLGRYRVLEQVGSGGMSVVYKGLDTALDREVAIKVLHPHLAKKEESRARLAREARAVAKLHHPNILEIFDVSASGTQDAFLVTEYIRGKTLRDFAQGTRIHPPELAAMIIHELAAALAHAHEAGVIHRDIKPENVMVRDDGVLKLMDFGIAKLLDKDERMTQTGALVGSPAHMAPEIIEGEEARPASDVFSLGTLLYWLATGELPFTAANTTATLKRILDADYEDPRQRSTAISDDLSAILQRCLARDPGERYANAAALNDALYAYLTPLGLERPSEELASFFADPPSYERQLVLRLTGRLVEQAEALLVAKRPAKALARLDQVLALAPDHPRALSLVAEMNRRRRRRKLLLRMSGVLAVSLALAGAGVGTARLVHLLRARAARARQAAIPPAQATPPPPPAVAGVTPLPQAPPASGATPAAPAQKPELVPAHTQLRRHPAGGATAQPISVEVLVRPYGYIQVDGGPRSGEALAEHTIRATPGKHRVTVSCDFCEETSEVIDVKPGAENVFPLPAEMKPARVSFRYEPPNAEVRIGRDRKSAEVSLTDPFVIRSPRGPVTFLHQIEYEVSRPGFKPEHKRVSVPPGATTVLTGRLAPL